MEEYYRRRPGHLSGTSSTTKNENPENGTAILSEYDQYRQSLISKDDDEGWNSKYRCYMKDRPANVNKNTDIVWWWQLSFFLNQKFHV